MAEAIVSTILEQLATIGVEEARREVNLVLGAEEEVRKLSSNFLAIQAVLGDAEVQQLKNPSVRDWVEKLRAVSYDIEDVLDEWNTALMRTRLERGGDAPHPTNKVCSFLPSPCFCLKQVALRHEIGKKIQVLNKRLEDIATEKDRYHFRSLTVEQPVRQITGPVIDVSEIEGRKQDKNRIIQLLLSENSETPNPRVISIVGMGGIGKTTLAQLTYDNVAVKSHFEKRVWVCVSDPFDEIRIARSILESILGFSPNLVEIGNMLEQIQQRLGGKKFLLILDDVWNEDFSKWKQLRDSLSCGLEGSKIVVTTRKESVAGMMGSSDLVSVGPLSTEESWSLFNRFAFFGRGMEETQNLEDIGRKIINKCKGLPLAIRTLGSLLRFKKSREDWQIVLDSQLWEIENGEHDVFASLRLSYIDLPHEIKQCFLYCAILPKDCPFPKDELIRWWMAQGYIRPSERKVLQKVGDEYFESLATRSFFQHIWGDSFGVKYGYRMHDIVHDFAQSLTKNECAYLKIYDSKELRRDSINNKGIRHMGLYYHIPDESSLPMFVYEYQKLRSLVLNSTYDAFKLTKGCLDRIFNELGCLRTLNLSHCGIEEVPSSIKNMSHMRYLDLSRNGFKELPKALCRLFNLKILDVSGCEHPLKVRGGIGKLVNLICLKNQNRHGVGLMEGLKNLSCLRELDVFYVNEDGSNLGDLGNFNQLRGMLEIRWLGDVTDSRDAKRANLQNKLALSQLRLDFKKRIEGRVDTCDEEVIEALVPPPDLEGLWIENHRGRLPVFPSWIMSLHNLKVVGLIDCQNMEHLPPLGKLPSLEKMLINDLISIKRVGGEFLGIAKNDDKEVSSSSSSSSSSSHPLVVFPKLRHIQFLGLEELEEWEDNAEESTISIMPSLRSIFLGFCPKLKALPDYLLQPNKLQKLTISQCPILKERFQKETGEDWPKICCIPEIEITS